MIDCVPTYLIFLYSILRTTKLTRHLSPSDLRLSAESSSEYGAADFEIHPDILRKYDATLLTLFRATRIQYASRTRPKPLATWQQSLPSAAGDGLGEVNLSPLRNRQRAPTHR